jgi:hypothetical protein
MGFVGGFLLLENDMVRLGDWIEIPGTGINGNVFDISLTIVKVRNWDNTIATIPPYTLINQSFINWRGMNESGGRRIARGYTLKLDHIKPCTEELLQKLKDIDSSLKEYIESLYKIENWPSEKLLAAAEETNLKTWITVDKVAHLPTDPTQWLDADKKKLDYYTTILIGLFLDNRFHG